MAKNRVPKAVRAYLRKIGKAAASTGGHARRDKLTAERRSEIARRAAETRWAREKKRKPE